MSKEKPEPAPLLIQRFLQQQQNQNQHFNNVHFKHHLKFNDFYKIDYYTKNIKRPQQRLQQRQLPAPLLIQRFLQPHQKKNNNDFNRFHYKHNFNNNDNYNKDIKPYFNV
jgi:hypothetical protein